MDTSSRRQTPRRAAGPGQERGAAGERRRLVQLLISVALFLLVFAGSGIFPKQLQVWKQLLTSDVDFGAAFRQFGQSVSEGVQVRQALEDLCVAVLGGQTEQEPPAEQRRPAAAVTLLGQSELMGLRRTQYMGLLAGRDEPVVDLDKAPEPEPSLNQEPEPDPTAQVVTAVAQAYTADGVKLPSNVSLEFYELGLAETVAPVLGPVTSTFGYRDSPINGRNEFHLALDIGAAEGTEIRAFADGVVEYIGESDEFGLYFKIRHDNNVCSFYAHCSRLLVRKGEEVSCGQTVALVGHTGNATGSHLHLTIEKDNIRLDPAYYVETS